MTPLSAGSIALSAELLHDDQSALRREWLVTNGIGGYAMSSVATANTRRYHGLLVAALQPPLGRAVLLSKLEPTLEIIAADGTMSQTFALSANLYPGVLYPQGHHLLESFTISPVPTWIWSPMPGVRFEQRIWMPTGRNATVLAFRLLDAPPGASAHINLVPLLAWKDFHSEMHAAEPTPDLLWYASAPQTAQVADTPQSRLRITLPAIAGITAAPTSLNISLTAEDGTPFPTAAFAAGDYWYYRFQHPREQERGQDFEEDLYSVGMLSASLQHGESLMVVAEVDAASEQPASTSEAMPALVPTSEAELAALIERRRRLAAHAPGEDAFAHSLLFAAEAFRVSVPGKRTTVIAGYPWFSDWGRDTMISLPGLCIATGQLEAAREILVSFASYVDHGMLPNRFPDAGEIPEYNTVDATLWYFVAIYRYVEASHDVALLKEALWPVLESIVRFHQQGTRYNIHVDPADQLLFAGQPGVQLTWMDAKIGDWVVTPRTGKPVEINALWTNALETMAHFARRMDNSERASYYAALAGQAKAGFNLRFPRQDGRGLYDVVDAPGSDQPDGAIRPNQIFAISLPFAPLDAKSEVASAVITTVLEELYTEVGIRTLSPRDPAYRPRYEGDQWHRDSAYHQGTAWPWLTGAFAEAHYKVLGDRGKALDLLRPLGAQLTEFGMGSLPEIYDGDAPQRPNGCIAQAWSVAETLRVWLDLSRIA